MATSGEEKQYLSSPLPLVAAEQEGRLAARGLGTVMPGKGSRAGRWMWLEQGRAVTQAALPGLPVLCGRVL